MMPPRPESQSRPVSLFGTAKLRKGPVRRERGADPARGRLRPGQRRRGAIDHVLAINPDQSASGVPSPMSRVAPPR